MGKAFRDFKASASVGSGSSATLISERWFSVPGMITWIAMDIQDPTQWTTATFSLKINGLPATDYGKVQDQIGSLRAPSLTRIPVPADALVEITAQNGAASSALMAARIVVEG